MPPQPFTTYVGTSASGRAGGRMNESALARRRPAAVAPSTGTPRGLTGSPWLRFAAGALVRAPGATACSIPSSSASPAIWLRSAAEWKVMPMPAAPGAAGAPDAVDVGVAILGRVEVDHVRDAVHVDAARGDVGRDQRADLRRLEAGERALALALRAVAVHRDGAARRGRQGA